MALGVISGGILRQINNIFFSMVAITLFFVAAIVWCGRNNSSVKLLFYGAIFFAFFCIGYIKYDKQCRDYNSFNQLLHSREEESDIYGTVKSIEYKENSIYITIHTKKYGKILGIIYNDYKGESPDYAYINGMCNFTMEFMQFSEECNYGNFSENKYYRSLGYSGKGICKNINLIRENPGIKGNLEKIREKMNNILLKCAGNKYGPVISAITFGNKGMMDKNYKEKLSINGLSHVMTVSGMHVSTVAMVISFLCFTVLGKKISIILINIILCFYGIMTGGSISCVRAVIMYIIKSGGLLFGRKYSPSIGVSISATYIFMKNPHYITNQSFFMSYMAIMAVLLISPLIIFQFKERAKRHIWYKNKVAKAMVYSVIISLTINIFMYPLICLNYYEVPVYSPVLNILLIPLLTFCFLSALLCVTGYCIFYCISGEVQAIIIGRLLVSVGKGVLITMEKCCDIAEKLPFNKIITGKPETKEVIYFYGIIFIICIWMYYLRKITLRKKKLNAVIREKVKYINILLVVCLIFGFIIISNNNHIMGKGYFISFINVGQGECILIKDMDNKIYMMDCGSSSNDNICKNRVIPHIKALGIKKIDYLIISHGDNDHVNGITDLLNDKTISIGTVIMGENYRETENESMLNIKKVAEEERIKIVYVKEGDRIISGEYTMECVYGGKKLYDDENANGLVFLAIGNNFNMLLTGDMGEEQEKQLISSNNQSLYKIKNKLIVLKVAHHGSKYSSCNEFIEFLQPEAAVISYGKNNYGHPSPEVINKLKEVDTIVLETIKKGVMLKYNN